MKAKKSVVIAGCGFEIGYAAAVCEGAYKAVGLSLVITSARDSQHSTNSLHYVGKAIDLRTNGIPKEVVNGVFAEISKKLEPLGFDCINEGNHLHIEFQPKAGEKFIEVVE